MPMIPRFALARPRSLDDAFAAFDAAGGDAAWYAGGTELLQVLKMGLAQFGTLVDVKGLPGLDAIEALPDGGVRIGGAVTHRAIERSPVVAAAIPALADLETHLANVRVRNQGTIGGNLAFAEPHSDPATLLLACDGRVVLQGRAGVRSLAIDDFVLGPLYTAREADELLTAVEIPGRGAGTGRAYAKFKFFERPAVSVAVRVTVEAGVIAAARVVVGSLAEVPTVVEAAGAALAGAPSAGPDLEAALATAGAAVATLDAEDDLNGSADYKRHLAGVLVRRTVPAAISEATAHA
jgi:carbon-monoxide dehydrogenase medium subunit